MISSFYFSGDIRILGIISFTLQSALNEASPQFTLTCISTGGPATTVTWTRTRGNSDTEVIITGNMTLLNNTEAAQYIHTLNVTGRLGGLYICTVVEDKISDSAQLYIKGSYYKTHLTK